MGLDDDIDEWSPGSDAALDKIMAGLKRWSKEELSAYCDAESGVGAGVAGAGGAAHPLFLARSPTSADVQANPTLSALANVAYDEIDSPESLAGEAKAKGCEAYGRGRDWFGHALRYFNEALDHASRSKLPPKDPRMRELRALRAACHANLAAVFLARKKYISCVVEAEAALKLTPHNVRAAFRAGTACLAMGKAEAGAGFAALGLSAEPGNPSLLALAASAAEAGRVQAVNAAATAAAAAATAARLAGVRTAVRARGLAVGPPLFAGLRRTPALPGVDEEGRLEWPVALVSTVRPFSASLLRRMWHCPLEPMSSAI